MRGPHRIEVPLAGLCEKNNNHGPDPSCAGAGRSAWAALRHQ